MDLLSKNISNSSSDSEQLKWSEPKHLCTYNLNGSWVRVCLWVSNVAMWLGRGNHAWNECGTKCNSNSQHKNTLQPITTPSSSSSVQPAKQQLKTELLTQNSMAANSKQHTINQTDRVDRDKHTTHVFFHRLSGWFSSNFAIWFGWLHHRCCWCWCRRLSRNSFD